MPTTLRRAFQSEEHARQFMAGEIRFGLLQRYQTIEGCRQDETEGKASVLWNLKAQNPDLNNITYSGSSLNLYYILCTSHPAVCKCHLTTFGRFVVRINEPIKLLERVCTAWDKDGRASSSAFMVPVVYNKGELMEPNLALLSPPCLIYAQKPPRYWEDQEFRYVLECEVGTKEDPFLTLNVEPCTDICSLVP